MQMTYEEAIQYDIDKAIKIIGEPNRKFSSPQERQEAYINNPAKIPNNPLLTDYNWVYDHAEKLFCQNKFDYQQYQSKEAYYTLFKALTNKYPIEKDYSEMLHTNQFCFNWKWGLFANHLIDFLTHAFDDRLKELLSKPDVINYFLDHPIIYDIDTISTFSSEGMEIFLKYSQISSHYTNNYKNLIQLIRKYPKIKIPIDTMLNTKVIKDLSRTHHIEEFYYNLHFVREQVADQPFLDEHVKYCDEQIDNIDDGILPCYQKQYKKDNENITIKNIRNFNYMEKQVLERIYKRNNTETLPKKYIYQELSKYMIIGMFMSRNYQTDPYNLLIDIETLQNFATAENKQLQGEYIYNSLMYFEEKELTEIINFYNQYKELPLIEILYDDWTNQKNEFINELNSKIYTTASYKPITKNDITYYDITDIEEPIIVHNTAILVDDKKRIDEMVEKIKQGYKHCICLSIQDQNHNTFYEENNTKNKKTLKLAYGPLIPNRVGTICHTDAYSQGINDIEIDNREFKRRLYTMKTLMDKTTDYNELVYLINGIPTLPIGIICEDEITIEEQTIAKELNIPLLYRKKKESTYRPYERANISKRYTYTKDKYMF